jgi:hypothetical protein
MVFHLPNFHNYVGAPIRFGVKPSISTTRGRLSLRDISTELVIDQQPQYQTLIAKLRRTSGFGLGHVGTARKRTGEPFTDEELGELSTCLHFFFSFVRGIRCGPVVPIGRNAQKDLWTEWGPWRVSSWNSVASWFPAHEPGHLEEAYRGFRGLWEQQLWRDPLIAVIHWYTEANQQTGGVEGALMFAQTALELLGWVHLVEDLEIISHHGFDQLQATDKIRLLLSRFSISTAIPSSYSDLSKSRGVLGGNDGPDMVTQMRNAIVHGNPKKRRSLARTARYARFQAVQLALSYLELVLLGLFGYKGSYVRRETGRLASDAAAPVPWR